MSPLFGRSAPTPEPTPAAVVDRFHVPRELEPFYRLDLMDIRKLDEDGEYRLALDVNRARLAADRAAWDAVVNSHVATANRDREHIVRRRLLEGGPWRYVPNESTAERWISALTDEDRRFWCHVRALERATVEHQRATRRAVKRERVEADATCDVCGDRDDGVKWRHVNGYQLHTVASAGVGGADVRACEPCAVALVSYLEAEAAATLGPDGRSRAELVAEWREANR